MQKWKEGTPWFASEVLQVPRPNSVLSRGMAHRGHIYWPTKPQYVCFVDGLPNAKVRNGSSSTVHRPTPDGSHTVQPRDVCDGRRHDLEISGPHEPTLPPPLNFPRFTPFDYWSEHRLVVKGLDLYRSQKGSKWENRSHSGRSRNCKWGRVGSGTDTHWLVRCFRESLRLQFFLLPGHGGQTDVTRITY